MERFGTDQLVTKIRQAHLDRRNCLNQIARRRAAVEEMILNLGQRDIMFVETKRQLDLAVSIVKRFENGRPAIALTPGFVLPADRCYTTVRGMCGLRIVVLPSGDVIFLDSPTLDYFRQSTDQESISHHIYHCYEKCERMRQTRYLPEEMFFSFLLHVPAQDLQDVMRHVCREWNLMIRSQNFIRRHLQNSAGGIQVQELFSARNTNYLEMRRGYLEMRNFDCVFANPILASCNGLVLTPDSVDPNILYVINPVTRQQVVLPPYFRQTGNCADFGLAFVEASMDYKVVHTDDNEPFGAMMKIAVLTVGVDRAWREIDIEPLSLTTGGGFFRLPLVTGGYVHWIGKTFVFTLNVETEIVCKFPRPRLLKEGWGNFLPMGSKLSYIFDSSECLMVVWEMNPETGEWTELLSFDSKPLSFSTQRCGNNSTLGLVSSWRGVGFQHCISSEALRILQC